MTRWYGKFEVAVTDLDETQRLSLLDEPVVMLHFDDDAQIGEVTLSVDADGYASACRKTVSAYDRLPAAVDLTAAGLISAPHRVTVERADAQPAPLGVLSTRGVAARLGVSATRVRQLSTRPDFPVAIEVPGLDRAPLYRVVDIDDFLTGWDRDAKPGRPPKATQ